MKTNTVKALYTKGMSFDIEIGGHIITVDAGKEVGGQGLGPSPKPLMLASLAGCTGMDVVSLLKKMRIDFDEFNLKIEGELNDEHPKKYNKIVLYYQFTGNDIPLDKVEKAVTLSLDKYCGVSAVYKQVIDLRYVLEINDKISEAVKV
ncbi:MAG: OsmC family protein [Ignavibacteria bacterium]|nr:OsmC family protein [Ignavibacteria bacterium]